MPPPEPLTTGLEITWRLGCFLAIGLLMAIWELWHPFRQLQVGRGRRWFCNLGLLALNTFCVRALAPLSAVAAAQRAQTHGWGLLAAWHGSPLLEAVIAILALDLAIYLQHRLFHAVPVLWRLHQVHHADLDLDVTTGTRFHLLEILLSALFKVVVVIGLGASPLAVVVFEILLNGSAMFNHANVELPARLEHLLRWCLVTPGMHRIHHSAQPADWNTNYGFQMSWWDRLLNTYRARPVGGEATLQIGLPEPRDPHVVDRLAGALWLPFSDNPSPRSPGDTTLQGNNRHDS
jgi:sterol desaturase/sphingolipid hydroxylase (fatty acid hydroxylase superfamily)